MTHITPLVALVLMLTACGRPQAPRPAPPDPRRPKTSRPATRPRALPGGFVTLKQHRARLDQRCQGGDGLACQALSHQRNVKLRRRYGRLARSHLERACLAGKPRACVMAAFRWRVPMTMDGKADKARARRLLEVGCKGRQGGACQGLSWAVRAGTGGPRDLKRAAVLLKLGWRLTGEACAAEPADQEACANLAAKADRAARGAGAGAKQKAEARRLFAKLRGLYTTSCKRGDPDSCLSLAVLYADGKGGPADVARAGRFADLACAHHHVTGCEKRPSSLVAACKRGDPDRCAQLGNLYAEGATASRAPRIGRSQFAAVDRMPGAGLPLVADKKKARALLAKACAGDAAEGCFSLAHLNRRGGGGAKNLARARALYIKACKLGDRHGCHMAGFMWRGARGGRKNEATAQRYYARACKLGAETSCNEVPAVLARRCGAGRFEACYELANKLLGSDKATDRARAHKLHAKACKGQVSSSCNLLGILNEKGAKGVKIDLARGRKYYGLACAITKGVRMGCVALGRMLRAGRGGAKDLPGARKAFAAACASFRFKACYDVGVMYARGQGGPKDRVKALRYLTKACRIGHAKACKLMQSL